MKKINNREEEEEEGGAGLRNDVCREKKTRGNFECRPSNLSNLDLVVVQVRTPINFKVYARLSLS